MSLIKSIKVLEAAYHSYYTHDGELTLLVNDEHTIDVGRMSTLQGDEVAQEIWQASCGCDSEDGWYEFLCAMARYEGIDSDDDEFNPEDWFKGKNEDQQNKLLEERQQFHFENIEMFLDENNTPFIWAALEQYIKCEEVMKFYLKYLNDDLEVPEATDIEFFAKMLHKLLKNKGLVYGDLRGHIEEHRGGATPYELDELMENV